MNRGSDSRRGIRPSKAAGAFTLIELLVVIVIIGILAGILLPALIRLKEKARSVQCLNNQKQWVLAFIMYKDDSEFIPREGFRSNGSVRPDNWAQVRHKVSEDTWYNVLPPYLSELPARTYASASERAKFYENRLFHCPSAKFPPGFRIDNTAFFSLVMNSKLIMPPNALLRYDAIQIPSRTVAFIDARVSPSEIKVDLVQGNFDKELGQPSAFSTRFAARHSRGGNVAFCDGHLESLPGDAVVETRTGRAPGFARFPDGDLLWCADPWTNPNIPDD